MKKILALSALLFASFSSTAAPEKTVNITYVPTPFNLQLMVMRDQGLLDAEFAKHNAKVEWHKISSGVHQAKAMAAGSVDIASVMNTSSLLMAAREGNNIKVIANVARPAKVFALVGKAGFDGDVTDLKGKKIAGAKGTVVQQMLIAQLHNNDMHQRDVTFINMGTPKAFNALMAGSVDAALLTSSFIFKAQDAGAKVLATAQGHISPILVSVTTDKFAQENPALVEAYITAQKKALAFIADHQDQALEIGAKEHGVSKAQASDLLQWSALTANIEQQDMNALAADEQFLVENNLMRAGLDVSTLIAPTSATQHVAPSIASRI